MVAETVAALRELAIHNSVRLVWVLGHHGVPGNEVADALAKQASAQCYIGPEPVLGVTSTTVRNAVRQWSVWEQNRLHQISSDFIIIMWVQFLEGPR